MDISQYIRRFLISFPTRRERIQKQQQAYIIEEGLPKGMAWETLDSLCKAHFSSAVCQVSHQHLSAWKISGAYRLFIHLTNGIKIQLIFKESQYNEKEIPGLVNLPVNLALPEYVIYRQNTLQPLPYLPRVYLADEIVAGERYQYLFEDLGEEYQRIKQGEEILYVSSEFGRISDALGEWASKVNLTGLIQYDKNFSLALQDYAFEKIMNLDQQVSGPLYEKVIHHWSEICTVHMQTEFLNYPQTYLIHGDMNFSNIHIHQKEIGKIKLVDWEWAGFGNPMSDFVSLTKGTPGPLKIAAIKKMLDFQGRNNSLFQQLILDQRQLNRMMNWCQIERSMLDAGFLSAQLTNQSYLTKFSLPKAINRSLERLIDAYSQLIH